jgi:hypothetical protein
MFALIRIESKVAFGGFEQHRLEIFPLVVGKTRSVFGIFHRLNGSFRLKLARLSDREYQQLTVFYGAFL